MLWDGDGVVGVVVVAPDLLHVQVAQDSAEYDVEELNTVGILDHAHISDGHCGLRPIRWSGYHHRDSLGGRERGRERERH